MSKYISNCSPLLSEICGSDQSPTIVNLEFDRLPVNKTLGVFLNAGSDNFEIKVRLKQKPATHRGILSMASQIFDPFGLVQPHALPVKRLMQQLCEMNSGWVIQFQKTRKQCGIGGLRPCQSLKTLPYRDASCLSKTQVQSSCIALATPAKLGTVLCATFESLAVLPGAVNLSLASQE